MSILKIGVFFDGTGQNAHNYLMKKPRKEKSEVKKDEKLEKEIWAKDEESQLFKLEVEAFCVIPDEYETRKSSSYTNPPTNIWHLYNHYKQGRTAQGYQIGVYVSGVGTEDGKEDDLVAMATGWSLKPDWTHFWLFGGRDTGVKDKAALATKLIKKQLKKSIKDMEGITFETIEFELFGFSRGATTARHFANQHAKGNKDLVKALKSAGLNKKLYPEIQTKPLGSINMIGLFDSVAAILALSENSWDLSDPKTGSIDIKLEKDTARHVFHITAGHEVRYNFSLNRTLPNHAKELELPGCHSDIGGGYNEDLEESLFMTKPAYSLEDKDTDNKNSQAHTEAEKGMAFLLSHPRWGALLKECKLEILDWNNENNGPKKMVGSAVIMKRSHVRTGIEVIALNAMRDYCVKAGNCVFRRFGFDADVAPPSLPEDLIPLRDSVYVKLSMINDRRKNHSAADDIDPKLAARYIHCSSYWGNVNPGAEDIEKHVGLRSVPNTILFNVLLTNRPTDDYVRHEYTADGQVVTKALPAKS